MNDSALALFKQVELNLKDGVKLDESIAILDSLVTENIDLLSAYYCLGNAFTLKSLYAVAERFYKLALEIKPNEPSILNNIACSYMEQGRHQEAIDQFKACMGLEKDFSVYENLSVCYVHLGDLDEGLKWAEMAYKEDPDNFHIRHNLSQVYLGLGRYKEGFPLYEARLLMPDRKERFYTEDKSDNYWDGTKGQTIIVHGEQGLGDEMMFASMLPDVMKDCDVIFDCNSRLVNIMRDSFPDIPVYGTKQQNSDVEWAGSYQIDAKVSIGSLAKFYRKDAGDFPRTPYLKADAALVEKYRQKLADMGNKPKIGISWCGGAKRNSQSYRFNPLINWLDIFGLDCDFISLQYNAEAGDKIDKFNKENGTNILHWPEMVADYDETAALLMNLDLVISAPQSVVHLAGGLGVPCWRLCARQAMWLHGEQDKDAPWYGTVSNYWQETAGDWKPVMKRVYEDLQRIL